MLPAWLRRCGTSPLPEKSPLPPDSTLPAPPSTARQLLPLPPERFPAWRQVRWQALTGATHPPVPYRSPPAAPLPPPCPPQPCPPIRLPCAQPPPGQTRISARLPCPPALVAPPTPQHSP